MTAPATARVAVYAGSFDPPTFGHTDLVERGLRVVERLVVGVGRNPRKRYRFDLEQRKRLLAASLGVPIVHDDGTREIVEPSPDAPEGLADRVEIRAFDGLLVDFCLAVGANLILRGLRAVADFDFEFQLGLANRDLEPEIETVFLLTRPETLFVSSSIVKEMADGGRDVSHYVPRNVVAALDAVREADGRVSRVP